MSEPTRERRKHEQTRGQRRDDPRGTDDGPATDHGDPVDWQRFWRKASEQRRRSAHVGQFGHAELLASLFDHTGVPDDFASFGCGPAAPTVELADRYPELDAHGFDVAPAALDRARDRAAAAGVENVTFRVDGLPDLETDRQFDVVYCYATLHYVADAEVAVRNLYDRVREGGDLVFNYPNAFTRATYRRMVTGESDLELPGDPGDFRERFRLVFEGRNLLSYDRIAEVLGSWPRSVYSLVDAPDGPWIGRHNPCVYVPN